VAGGKRSKQWTPHLLRLKNLFRNRADWRTGLEYPHSRGLAPQGNHRTGFTTHFPEFTVERADQITKPGSINSQVITRLWDAPLVIADMSGHNANAFYELAIRHVVRLPTIHIILSTDQIPFDNAPYRAIRFSCDTVENLQKACLDLSDATTSARYESS
jgi:hypothetical protein